MNPKVSVIIPVYNAEKYLEECIKSLINQTLKECEFIFINDGSTDSSLEILNRYKIQDSRVIIISQENKGVSAARNVGIDIAKGDYLGFVDADDFIESNFYEIMFKTSKEQYDIVISSWSENNLEKQIDVARNEVINRKNIKKYIIPILIGQDYLNSVCNKLYISKLVENNNILFPTGTKLGEDREFNIRAFSKAGNCFFINFCGYHYREVMGSATHNLMTHDYFKRLLEVYNENFEDICDLETTEIEKLKSEKLIGGVISLTYICFDSKDSLDNRYKYIQSMIKNQTVQNVVKKYGQDFLKNRGRYDRTVLKCIKNKNILGIYFLTLYSRFRNRKRRISDEDNDV